MPQPTESEAALAPRDRLQVCLQLQQVLYTHMRERERRATDGAARLLDQHLETYTDTCGEQDPTLLSAKDERITYLVLVLEVSEQRKGTTASAWLLLYIARALKARGEMRTASNNRVGGAAPDAAPDAGNSATDPHRLQQAIRSDNTPNNADA